MDWFWISVYLYVVGGALSLCILVIWAAKKGEELNQLGAFVVCLLWFVLFPIAGIIAAFKDD